MQGAPERAHGGICLWSSTVHEKRVGQCSDGTCSPNKASCGSGLDFMDAKQSTENCDVDSTAFGRCGDRCSWSPDDCSVGEEWTFPSEGCSCDKVQVGACEKDGQIFCSVSPDSCDDKATWLHALDVVSTTPNVCYLCRAKSIPIVPTTAPVAAPVAAPVDLNKPSSKDSIIAVDNVKSPSAESNPSVGYNPSTSSKPSGGPNTGVVVGAVVGGVGGAAMVLVLFMFARKRQIQNSRAVVKAPLPYVEVS